MLKRLLQNLARGAFALLLFCTPVLAQQSVTVTGTVKDNAGQPLIGVAVVEKDRPNGTATDSKGYFSFRVSDLNATLSFSFIGMESKEVPLAGAQTLAVIMEEEHKIMEQVVVIGYGTVAKSDLTGSVASVSANVFNERLVTSMEDALRGQVAGVRVSTTDGQPGAEINLRVRGAGSINASNAPLYVIDGLPMEGTDININPGDIQSMEILKDASATAIYGSRGSNGVVLITTKQGQKGKTRVNFNLKSSLQEPIRLIQMMNSYEYAKMRYDQINTGASAFFKHGSTLPTYAPNQNYYLDSEGNINYRSTANYWADYETYADPANYNTGNPDSKYIYTDWQRAMLSNAPTYDLRATISGGDDNTRFSILGNYYSMKGILLNTGFDRISVRVNFDRNLSQKVKWGVTMNGLLTDQTGTTSQDSNGVIINMLGQPPTKKLTEEEWIAEDGESTVVNNNPFYQAKRIVNKTYRNNLSFRTYFDMQLTSWLRYNLTGNYNFSNSTIQHFYPSDTNQGRSENGRAQYNVSESAYWLNENLFYFTPNVTACNKLKCDLMVGATFEQRLTKNLNAETRDFALDGLDANSLQMGVVSTIPTTTQVLTRMASFFSRGNITWDNRYLLTATIRFDGSSRFGIGNKWALFPSASFGWKITEEPFLKNIKEISTLKWRIGMGSTGNNSIPSLQSRSGMSPANYAMNGEGRTSGIAPDRIKNPNLKWETSIQYNTGIDFGLLGEKFSGTVDLYYKQTRDLLFDQPVMASTGYTSSWSNIGAVDNKGIEATLNGRFFSRRKIRWNSSFNIFLNRSKVVSLGEASFMILNPSNVSINNIGILEVGKPLGCWYGYRTNEVFRLQSEIDALPDDYAQHGNGKEALFPGYTRFVDINNDGIVNDEDRVILAVAEPKFTGGWQNTISYANFSLAIGLEYKYGGTIFNATQRYLMQMRGANNTLKKAADYWQPTLYDITTAKIVFEGDENSTMRRPGAVSELICMDLDIEDASYLRINDVTLSYTLPAKLLPKLNLKACSVFFSVNNAYVFTKYSGYDPDVSVARGVYSDLVPGVDWAAYLRTRGYTFGINATF